MFEDLPDAYIVKKSSEYYRLIRFHNNVLYISDMIYDMLDSDDMLILWMIMRNKYDLKISNVYNVYEHAFNEWKMYGKSGSIFIKKLVLMIEKYSRNKRLKNEHIEYLKNLV